MSKPTMSEIIAEYNILAAELGKPEVTSFKNLSAARAALKSLESNDMTDTNDTAATDETTGAPGLDTPSNSGPKYNSTGKRGPTQGIGAFCKGLIAEGKTNPEILEAIAEQFPTAKTSTNCVAYYRAKMKKASAPTEVTTVPETEVEAEAEAA